MVSITETGAKTRPDPRRSHPAPRIEPSLPVGPAPASSPRTSRGEAPPGGADAAEAAFRGLDARPGGPGDPGEQWAVEADRERERRAASLLSTARDAPKAVRRRLRQRVILEYLELADAVANRYRNPALDMRELRQVAYLGLTKAVRRFDPARGDGVVAFAVPTIAGEIKRFLRDTSWIVRPPRALQELSLEIGPRTAELEQRLGREPTLAELARATGRTASRVAEAVTCNLGRRPVSLDAPVPGDPTERILLGDALPSADTDFERAELAMLLNRALEALTPSERRIVHLRFFEELTQSEIAEEMEVSQMQISRLLRRILSALRTQLTAGIAPH